MGQLIVSGYGEAEHGLRNDGNPRIITAISGDFLDRPKAASRMPNFELRIIDDEGPLAPGQVGELTVRGAPVIRGYLNREDATAETIVDGFLRTGDVARVDEDGFVYIVDRSRIRCSGAVKKCLLRGGGIGHLRGDGIAECIVFMSDDRLGGSGSVIV